MSVNNLLENYYGKPSHRASARIQRRMGVIYDHYDNKVYGF